MSGAPPASPPARRPRPSREAAARDLVAALDGPFLRALAEPARLDLLRVLLLHGPANVGTLAGHLPQDRSVISRHLQVLTGAGLVTCERRGRERVYELDGPGFVGTLEAILAEVRSVAACCCAAPPSTRGGPPGACG